MELLRGTGEIMAQKCFLYVFLLLDVNRASGISDAVSGTFASWRTQCSILRPCSTQSGNIRKNSEAIPTEKFDYKVVVGGIRHRWKISMNYYYVEHTNAHRTHTHTQKEDTRVGFGAGGVIIFVNQH